MSSGNAALEIVLASAETSYQARPARIGGMSSCESGDDLPGYVYLYTSGTYEGPEYPRVDLSIPDVQMTFEEIEGYIE